MRKVTLLIPVYNDWKSLNKLLENINTNISKLDYKVSIIIVNDASTEEKLKFSNIIENISSLKILNLKNNIGHTRCIATGLSHIIKNEEFDYVIPMDGDGEDRPEEIKNFLEITINKPGQVIVGERVKRSEKAIFKISYFFHKLITLTFTGISIKFGNYTCLPKSTVKKMINDKSTWNSFSGSLSKLEKKRINSPSIRGMRYFGPSKMSFRNLILHSFSIMSVFKLAVLIRSLVFLIFYFFLIKNNFSIITIIPIFLVIFFSITIFILSQRENMEEFTECLKNILNIEIIKK